MNENRLKIFENTEKYMEIHNCLYSLLEVSEISEEQGILLIFRIRSVRNE